MRKRVLSLLLIVALIFQMFGMNVYAGDLKQANETSENVLALGNGHSGAIDSDGNLWMWGKNDLGQLGNGTLGFGGNINNPVTKPVKVKNITNVVYVTTKDKQSAAITEDGKLWLWGNNENGEIGNDKKFPYSNKSEEPINILSAEKFEKVELGSGFVVAITKDGKVYTWGKNNRGQLGNGTKVNSNVPVQILGDYKIKDVSIGTDVVAAITEDGKLFTWGYNNKGQVGNNTTTTTLEPFENTYITAKVVKVIAGDLNVAALDENGDLYVWGDNASGQIGNNDTSFTPKSVITPYKVLSKVSQFSLGIKNVAAITELGGLWTWGDNASGQIGNGKSGMFSAVKEPTQIMQDMTFEYVSLGTSNAIAIAQDGSLWAWGDNAKGQVGNGSVANVKTPEKIIDSDVIYASISGIKKSVSGTNLIEQSVAAVKSDGSLWMWGYNKDGQVGNGSTTDVKEPVKIIDKIKITTESAPVEKTADVTVNHIYNAVNKATSTSSIDATEVVVVKDQVVGSTYVATPVTTHGAFEYTIDENAKLTITVDENIANNVININYYRTIEEQGGNPGDDGDDTEFTIPYGKVAIGVNHSGAIDKDGNLWMWGKNDKGQLGIGTIEDSEFPVKVEGLKDVVYVAVGSTHSAAITKDGSLWTWGNNGYYGVLGTGKTSPNYNYTPTKIMDNIEKVVLGYDFSAAISKEGKLYTWGRNSAGQLGKGKSDYGANATPEVILANIKDVSLGDEYAAAITKDGRVFTWGVNEFGQIGNGQGGSFKDQVLDPFEVKEIKDAVQVVTGYSNTAVVTKDGKLWVWGDNYYGQVGNGQSGYGIKEKSPVNTMSNVKYVSVGYGHIVAIKSDGTLWSWGSNEKGQIGNGEGAAYTTVNNPVQVLADVKYAATSNANTIAIDKNDAVWTWGDNSAGQVGNASLATIVKSPVKVIENDVYYVGLSMVDYGFSKVYTSYAVAVKEDGSIWMWGLNNYGQVGNSSTDNVVAPVQIKLEEKINAGTTEATVIVKHEYSADNSVTGNITLEHRDVEEFAKQKVGENFEAKIIENRNGVAYKLDQNQNTTIEVKEDSSQNIIILKYTRKIAEATDPVSTVPQIEKLTAKHSLGENHTAFVKDGALWTWGYNYNGQLGDNTILDKNVPVKVMDDVEAVYLSGDISAVLKTDKSLWMWGDHGKGSIGIGPSDWLIKDPVEVLKNVVAVRSFNKTVGALTEDGKLYLWGENYYGQIGDGTSGYTFNKDKPVEVLTDVVSFRISEYNTAALKNDGTLWIWGDNSKGQVGNGKGGNYGDKQTKPAKANVPGKVLDFSIGSRHIGAITVDGQLYMWGGNVSGQIGNDGYSNVLQPLKIMDGVKEVELFLDHSAAINEEGKLFMWGNNTDGQLGTGNQLSQYKPVEVLTDVEFVKLESNYTAAVKKNGELWMWGGNNSGQIGDGTVLSKLSPVKVLSNIVSVALSHETSTYNKEGLNHTSAIDNNGDLWMWGNNKYGQVGNSSNTNALLPVKIDVNNPASPEDKTASVTVIHEYYLYNADTKVETLEATDEVVENGVKVDSTYTATLQTEYNNKTYVADSNQNLTITVKEDSSLNKITIKYTRVVASPGQPDPGQPDPQDPQDKFANVTVIHEYYVYSTVSREKAKEGSSTKRFYDIKVGENFTAEQQKTFKNNTYTMDEGQNITITVVENSDSNVITVKYTREIQVAITPINPGNPGGSNPPSPNPGTTIEDDKVPGGQAPDEKVDDEPIGLPNLIKLKSSKPVIMNNIKDVSTSDWFYLDVKIAMEYGLMTGTSATEFSPNSLSTRAMIATIIHRLVGTPKSKAEIPFEDVEIEKWYTESIRWAANKKIVNGITPVKFAPDNNVTREQLATLIYRYVKLAGKGYTENWTYKLNYADSQKIGNWANEAVCWMSENGILTGKPNNMFDPQGFATRAEIAAVFNRILKLLGE